MSSPSSCVESESSQQGVQQNQGDSGSSYWGRLGAAIQGGRRQSGMACELRL